MNALGWKTRRFGRSENRQFWRSRMTFITSPDPFRWSTATALRRAGLFCEARYSSRTEPASALDPIATAQLKKPCLELKKDYTIVTVTTACNKQPSSDYTGFFSTLETHRNDKYPRIFSKMRNCNRPTIMYLGHFDKVKWQIKGK